MRTTPEPSWTGRAWQSAPVIIAPSRLWTALGFRPPPGPRWRSTTPGKTSTHWWRAFRRSRRSSQYDQRPLSGDHPRPQQKAAKLPVARRRESEGRRLQPAVRGSVQGLSQRTRRRYRQGDVPGSRVRNFDRLGVFDDRGLEGQNRWRGRDSAGEVPRPPNHRSTIAEGP